MTENIIRGKGKGQGFKFDRGGVSVETGPYIGEIRNNIDPLRLGRVSVYIEEFAGPDKSDSSLWRTVRYLSPFFGTTEKSGNAEGIGTYEGNRHSYGMWFTPPDIGIRVLCFFPAGKHNDGYYLGCIPEPGVSHMVPGIAGAERENVNLSDDQRKLFAGEYRLPVTELNDEDRSILADQNFPNVKKPVHSVVANQLFQQGLLQDRVRGTIGSTSQRETPSSVYGVSSPGRPVYDTRLEDSEIREKLDSGEISPEDAKVVARKGGHSFVMDDGDLDGRDQMVRIRTARGHQITMSDSGDCFYITHANGQTWLEFGKEGTVDVYSSNSINLRTQGDLNLHADENVNINAGKFLNLNSEENLTAQSAGSLSLNSNNAVSINGDKSVGIRSGVTLALQSKIGSFSSDNLLSLRGGVIGLNTFPPTPVLKPAPIAKYPLSESKYDSNLGWQVEQGELKTIVTRAPTHEPYPLHNLGVALDTRLSTRSPAALAEAQSAAIESTKETQFAGIDLGDVSLQNPGQISLGSIEPQQVTALLAQAAKDTGQAAEEVTEKGIGKFAFTPDKLEEIGVLKPGSTEFFNNSDLNLETFVQNSQIWTGREGATSIETLINNVDLQDSIQQQVMSDRFLQLQDAGLITGEEPPEQLAVFVQTATKNGVGVTKQWIESFSSSSNVTDIAGDLSESIGDIAGDFGESLASIGEGFSSALDGGIGGIADDIGGKISDLTDNLGDINIAAAGANYAVNFAIQKIPALGSFFGGGGGTGTRSPLIDVNTSDLPEAFTQAADRIIAKKVPPFTTPDDGVPDQLG